MPKPYDIFCLPRHTTRAENSETSFTHKFYVRDGKKWFFIFFFVLNYLQAFEQEIKMYFYCLNNIKIYVLEVCGYPTFWVKSG